MPVFVGVGCALRTDVCQSSCGMEYGRSPQLAKVKLWSTRRKPGNRASRKASPQQIVGLRLWDFARLLNHRFGMPLPDNEEARDALEPILHHMAALTQPARRIAKWLRLWAPWLTLEEMDEITSRGIATARAWKADQLAWRYRLTLEERDMLGISTIGAIDRGKAARTKRRKARDRERKAGKRAAAGMTNRAKYEAASLERAKPWEAESVSRRTWYRRRKLNGTGQSAIGQRGTGPATP